jgi:hypothetical protein
MVRYHQDLVECYAALRARSASDLDASLQLIQEGNRFWLPPNTLRSANRGVSVGESEILCQMSKAGPASPEGRSR